MRNLIVCCDGTGNRFGTRNTNVAKLCSVIERDPEQQILFYDPGVGTMGDASRWTRFGKALSRAVDGAIGRTVKQNVGEAYAFLAHHYRPDDRIFLFGFSRGAYTVRALAGILHAYGLIQGANENLFPYIWAMYRRQSGSMGAGEDADSGVWFRVAASFKASLARRVPIHFIGVWDTVSSVGWFWDPVALPYTAKNPSVVHGRHAVSIDERRAFFRQNLWRPHNDQDLQEVWFAGVHSDVGGGYPEEESGLSKVAFEWMLHEAEAHGLAVDAARKSKVLGGGDQYAAPDPEAVMHDSLVGGWKLLEFLPRLRWSNRAQVRRWAMNLFRPRRIPDDAALHESVAKRLSAVADYRPPNLPARSDPAD